MNTLNRTFLFSYFGLSFNFSIVNVLIITIWGSLNYMLLLLPLLLLSHFSSVQLCEDLTDRSPLGFPVPGILQARIMEWAAISSSNA